MPHLDHAARALGWHGHVITGIEVLGGRAAPVARFLPEVHRWRSGHGWVPHADPSWFRSWSDPERHDHLPVPAVELLGFLVPVSKSRKGLRACGNLMTLAPCAVVLPEDHPDRPWPLFELDYYGIGVVTTGPEGPAHVTLRPENRSAEFGPSLFTRWLLEVLYSRLLERAPGAAGRSSCP